MLSQRISRRRFKILSNGRHRPRWVRLELTTFLKIDRPRYPNATLRRQSRRREKDVVFFTGPTVNFVPIPLVDLTQLDALNDRLLPRSDDPESRRRQWIEFLFGAFKIDAIHSEPSKHDRLWNPRPHAFLGGVVV